MIVQIFLKHDRPKAAAEKSIKRHISIDNFLHRFAFFDMLKLLTKSDSHTSRVPLGFPSPNITEKIWPIYWNNFLFIFNALKKKLKLHREFWKGDDFLNCHNF